MTHKERKEEVRKILALDTDELVKRAKGQLVLFPTLYEVYDYLAEEMVKEFAKAAKGKKIVNFIMPVGPTQPYRLMAEKINGEKTPAQLQEEYKQVVQDTLDQIFGA